MRVRQDGGRDKVRMIYWVAQCSVYSTIDCSVLQNHILRGDINTVSGQGRKEEWFTCWLPFPIVQSPHGTCFRLFIIACLSTATSTLDSVHLKWLTRVVEYFSYCHEFLYENHLSRLIHMYLPNYTLNISYRIEISKWSHMYILTFAVYYTSFPSMQCIFYQGITELNLVL